VSSAAAYRRGYSSTRAVSATRSTRPRNSAGACRSRISTGRHWSPLRIARLRAWKHSTASVKKMRFEVVRSRAILEDAHTVRLLKTGRCVRARAILIATGARPELPLFEGIELGITSDAVFDLKTASEKACDRRGRIHRHGVRWPFCRVRERRHGRLPRKQCLARP
jgi:hypothetical protein